MKLYKFLELCLKCKNLEKLILLLLKNYKFFDFIKKLKNNFNIKLFNLRTYDKSNDNKNILLMFRLLEKKFYDLALKFADRDLKYNLEIKGNDSKDSYLVFLTNSELKLNILKVYLLFYYVNIRLNKKNVYLGIDFEFNTKVVALMQINFEQQFKDIYKYSLIFLFDPKQLSLKWKNLLIERILCNKRVNKILHGSDSLDIPFIYDELLEGNIKLIRNFNISFIDTKFLCEFSYYSKNQELGKCKINYLLLKEGIITQNKFDNLQKEETDMGPIYDIIIDVNNISPLLLNYTLYDVLYLYHLTNYYKINFKEFDLINEITQLTLMEKRNIISVIPITEINNINNFYILINKKISRLNDIFLNFLNKYLLKNSIISILIKINYFKNIFYYIIKYELYNYLIKRNIVYEKYSSKLQYNKKILNLKYDYCDKKLFVNQIIIPLRNQISNTY
tara:strand:- start:585 stop:1928 length:1344 start_codon:yes stop_codon:yes gene_type:complete